MQAETLILAEQIDHRPRALGQQLVAEREAKRQLDRLEPPARLGRRRFQPFERLGELGRRLGRRVPAVPQRRHALERAGAVAADPDRRVRLLHRLGREADLAHVVELALEARIVLGPERLEDREHLVGLPAARVERRAQQLQLFLPPAHAHADDQAPLGQRVDRGEHLGHDDRMAMAEHEHGGAQARAGRHMAAAASVITGSR